VAKKVISYRLNENGTIPDFVEDGGYYPKGEAPLTMVLLGISQYGADLSGIEAEFPDEASAVTYVNTYLPDITVIDPITSEERVFIVTEAVANLFAKLA